MRRDRASGTATVLFTDLLQSTELMSRLGETAFDEVRRAHFIALRHAVSMYGGEEVKTTGDGEMAIFGSVVDAFGCAVAMQHATDRQARSGPVPVTIRWACRLVKLPSKAGTCSGLRWLERRGWWPWWSRARF